MARTRDGGEKIVRLAKALIVIVQTFAATLIKKYGAESGIGLLITAILALSQLLPEAEGDVLDFGGDNSDALENPGGIPGTDPSAPLPPELPE